MLKVRGRIFIILMFTYHLVYVKFEYTYVTCVSCSTNFSLIKSIIQHCYVKTIAGHVHGYNNYVEVERHITSCRGSARHG